MCFDADLSRNSFCTAALLSARASMAIAAFTWILSFFTRMMLIREVIAFSFAMASWINLFPLASSAIAAEDAPKRSSFREHEI